MSILDNKFLKFLLTTKNLWFVSLFGCLDYILFSHKDTEPNSEIKENLSNIPAIKPFTSNEEKFAQWLLRKHIDYVEEIIKNCYKVDGLHDDCYLGNIILAKVKEHYSNNSDFKAW